MPFMNESDKRLQRNLLQIVREHREENTRTIGAMIGGLVSMTGAVLIFFSHMDNKAEEDLAVKVQKLEKQEQEDLTTRVKDELQVAGYPGAQQSSTWKEESDLCPSGLAATFLATSDIIEVCASPETPTTYRKVTRVVVPRREKAM